MQGQNWDTAVKLTPQGTKWAKGGTRSADQVAQEPSASFVFAFSRSINKRRFDLPTMARPMSATTVALSSPSVTATTTITIQTSEPSSSSSSQNPPPQQQQQHPEVLFLPLNRKKKKVSWKEGTVDNEFMQKKSSKKCCIFHKQKPFDEDNSDEEDEPHRPDKRAHDHGDGGCCSGNHDEAGPSG